MYACIPNQFLYSIKRTLVGGGDELLSFGMFHLQDYSRMLMNVLRTDTLNSHASFILVCVGPLGNLPSWRTDKAAWFLQRPHNVQGHYRFR